MAGPGAPGRAEDAAQSRGRTGGRKPRGQAHLKGPHRNTPKWKNKDLKAFVLDLDFESNRITTFPSYKEHSKELILIV